MTFTLDTHWVWDFWLADDGHQFHLYYLHAPRSLGEQTLRHRNAVVGHATSTDLSSWADRGPVLEPGAAGAFDETATWTGSVVQGPDARWHMFYTGSRFLSPDSTANIETVGIAVSDDLHSWTKTAGAAVAADPRWYETLGTSSWREEAWRDPWVFADPAGDGWHMLITARSNAGDEVDRGVIGHATSRDLQHWTAEKPLSSPGAGFAHAEVPQVVTIDERNVLLFSCDSPALAGDRAGSVGGIWWVEIDAMTGPFDLSGAALLSAENLYSGRAIHNRNGEWMLLAFENATDNGGFVGTLTDPMPLGWSSDGSTLLIGEPA